jgi:hypothetical protein
MGQLIHREDFDNRAQKKRPYITKYRPFSELLAEEEVELTGF